MAFFTTFGSFSIAAGILLIFLIFVMLAAERRGELGIARAIGTRRGHLVQMFTFEGAAYDLIAAAVGAILGAIVAYGMVILMARAFGAEDADAGLQVQYAFTWQSLLIAFALGVLLTLARGRVLRLARERDDDRRGDPERARAAGGAQAPPHRPRRYRHRARRAPRRQRPGNAATPLMLGVSLVIFGLVPFARLVGVPDRIAYTVAGAGERRALDAALERLGVGLRAASDGLLDVDRRRPDGRHRRRVGDRLQRRPAPRRGDGRPRSDQGARADPADVDGVPAPEPVPDGHDAGDVHARRVHARHGLDLDRLVPGGARRRRRCSAAASTCVPGPVRWRRSSDLRSALDERLGRPVEGLPGGREPVRARRRRAPARDRATARGVPRARARRVVPRSTRPSSSGSMAHGYTSSREVWAALEREPGLAVVDSLVVPHRDEFGFTVLPSDFEVTGMYSDVDEPFDPIPLEVVDSQTGRRTRLTVIGVLSDSAPFEMAGISTSQATLAAAFPGTRGADDPLLLARARRRPRPGRRTARVRVPLERARGRVDPPGRRGLHGRQQDVQPPDPGLHGARARRRRRGARRDQRPRGRRAAPADRRDAGDRVPAHDDPGGVPARVVVRRPDGDLRRHRARAAPRLEHHPGPARDAELGERRVRRALGRPRARLRRRSTRSRCSRLSPRRSGPPGSHRPRRSVTSRRLARDR